MNKKSLIEDRFEIIFLSIGAIFLLIGIVLLHNGQFLPVAVEAFIHFRISQNFYEYGAPYFNLGEPIATSSSLLWTIVLIGLGGIFPISPSTLIVFNTIILILISLTTLAICRKLKIKAFHSLCISLLIISICAYSSCQLMETPLAIFLLLLSSLLMLQKQNSSGAIICLALLPFLRPEFALFSGLIYILSLQQGVFSIKKVGALLSIVTIPLIAISIYWYGSLIPQSVRAKSVVYDNDNLLELFWAIVPKFWFDTEFSVWLSVLFLIGLCYGYFRLIFYKTDIDIPRSLIRSLKIFPLAIMISYYLSGAYLHEWYYPIFACPIVFGALVGLISFRSKIRSLFYFLIIAPTLVSLGSLVVKTHTEMNCFEQRVSLYKDAGIKLKRSFPNAKVLSSEIGALGYYFPGYIYDALGLATPSATAFHPMNVPEERSTSKLGSIPPEFVRKVDPEIIVTFARYGEALLRSENILSAYNHHTLRGNCTIDDPDYDLNILHLFFKPNLNGMAKDLSLDPII